VSKHACYKMSHLGFKEYVAFVEQGLAVLCLWSVTHFI